MPRTWLYPVRNNPENTENERIGSFRLDLSNPRTIAIVPAYTPASMCARSLEGNDSRQEVTGTRGHSPSCQCFPFLFRLWPASASLLSLESSRRIESHAGTDPASCQFTINAQNQSYFTSVSIRLLFSTFSSGFNLYRFNIVEYFMEQVNNILERSIVL